MKETAMKLPTWIAPLLFAAALPVWAQKPTPGVPPELKALTEIQIDGAPVYNLSIDSDTPVRGDDRLVKGAPYCADAVHETVQPLVDASGQAGNRIVRQTQTRLCRDGEGRTRQEVERNGQRQVILRDPMARETWVLDPERKTARRSGVFAWSSAGAMPMADSAGWHDYAERVREWARGYVERVRSGTPRAASAPMSPLSSLPPSPPSPPLPPLPPMPPEAELVALARGATAAADQALRDAEMRIVRLQSIASSPPAPPAVAFAAQSFAPRGPGAVSSLGSKDLEGLRVNGERTTWTIDAGKVGNEKPIQIVRDVWTSPDLMLTVAVRDFDPRRGETNYRLTNVKRGEPDPALMKVPADYTRRGERAAGASAPKG